MKYLCLLFAIFSLVLAIIPKVTKKAILDIEIEGEKIGKIKIGLFGKIVPKTVKNFVELCKRPFGEGYKGSKFEQVERDMFVRTGYFTEKDGTTGMSYYKKFFDKENFELKHYGAGWVSMTSRKNDCVNTEFFIILQKFESLDGQFVVFGKVVEGMDIVRKIASVETDESGDTPMQNIVIADCTVEVVKKSFAVELTDATE